jgi:hypothetical protein
MKECIEALNTVHQANEIQVNLAEGVKVSYIRVCDALMCVCVCYAFALVTDMEIWCEDVINSCRFYFVIIWFPVRLVMEEGRTKEINMKKKPYN